MITSWNLAGRIIGCMTKVRKIEAGGQETCRECEIPHLIDAETFPAWNGGEESEYGSQPEPHQY